MTIRKRIIRSNLLMLLIPLAIICLIVRFLPGMIINLYGDWSPGNSVFPMQNKIHQLLQDKGELSQKEISMMEDRGYQLLIVRGNEEIYSSLTEQAEEIAAKSMEERVMSMVSVSRRTAVIRESVPYAPHQFITVIAVNTDYRSNPLMEEQIRHALSWVGPVTILVSLAAIMVTNHVLSNKMLNSILLPLELLRQGTRKIRDGNLDFQLSYDGKDEFRPVFDDFEDMRCRLQDSVAVQLKSEESRKELLAGISHDLRTPLTVIKGYAEGLNDGVAVTPEKQQKYLETIYRKACELDQLVDQLFLFSKMDTGRYPFTFQPADLGRFLDGFASMAADEFACQGLRVTLEREETDFPVLLDTAEFSRVLVNVLSNSAKYVMCEEPVCRIALKRQGENALLTLSDNGAGVAEENLGKLFESFYREDTSRSHTDKGSGLGLSIAKQIINAHGGSICAKNSNGLTIEICIPLRKEESPCSES